MPDDQPDAGREETELDFLAALFEDVRAIRRYLAVWFGLSMIGVVLAVLAFLSST